MPRYNNWTWKGVPLYTKRGRSTGAAMSKLKAAWRGKKTRKAFRGNQRGYLTKGKFVRVY